MIASHYIADSFLLDTLQMLPCSSGDVLEATMQVKWAVVVHVIHDDDDGDGDDGVWVKQKHDSSLGYTCSQANSALKMAMTMVECLIDSYCD